MFSPNMKFILDMYKLLNNFLTKHDCVKICLELINASGSMVELFSHTCFCANRLKLNLVINTSGARDD